MTDINDAQITLFGKNPETNVVAVYPYDNDRVSVVKRNGEEVEIEQRKFYPFFLLNDKDLLRGLPFKHWIDELEGDNYYKYLAVFTGWDEMKAAQTFVLQKYNLRHGTQLKTLKDTDTILVKMDPAYQYMVQSGTTLFKGIEYSDLYRWQLDIETIASGDHFPDPNNPDDKIFMISLSDNKGWEYQITDEEKDEPEMLRELIGLIREKNPDTIEGHNIYSFDLMYIMTRCKLHGIRFKVGRDGSEPRVFKQSMRAAERQIEYLNTEIAGRHVLDTLLMVQSYDIGKRALANYQLKYCAQYFGFASKDRTYIPGNKITEMWSKDKETVKRYGFDDVREVNAIAGHLSPTSFYMTQMMPFNLQQVYKMGSASKIEGLFVRDYIRVKHSIPNAMTGKQEVGGLTDIFYRGVFSHVIHADTESLYPSIIMTFKIAPSTDRAGTFLKCLTQLRQLRLDTKHAMKKEKDKIRKSQLDGMQGAFKILINSFYGYLGYSKALWNDFTAADKITSTGQQILNDMAAEITRLGGQVLEEDTDGIYCCTPDGVTNEAEEEEFVKQVGSILPKGVNLVLDGRYEKMISYRKKNYVLFHYGGKVEMKGSALISRSMEPFARKFIENVLKKMAFGDIQGIHDMYIGISEDLKKKKMPAKDLVKMETAHTNEREYLEKIAKKKRNKSAGYEAAIRADVSIRPGDKIYYYISGISEKGKAFDKSVYYDEERNPFPTDYNVQFYLSKLRTYAERFRFFFEPVEFDDIFSAQDGGLFPPDYGKIKVKNIRIETSELEEEEEEEVVS